VSIAVAGEVGQAEGVRAGVDRGDDDEATVELFMPPIARRYITVPFDGSAPA
jgi:hypothetical protein